MILSLQMMHRHNSESTLRFLLIIFAQQIFSEKTLDCKSDLDLGAFFKILVQQTWIILGPEMICCHNSRSTPRIL